MDTRHVFPHSLWDSSVKVAEMTAELLTPCLLLVSGKARWFSLGHDPCVIRHSDQAGMNIVYAAECP